MELDAFRWSQQDRSRVSRCSVRSVIVDSHSLAARFFTAESGADDIVSRDHSPRQEPPTTEWGMAGGAATLSSHNINWKRGRVLTGCPYKRIVISDSIFGRAWPCCQAFCSVVVVSLLKSRLTRWRVSEMPPPLDKERKGGGQSDFLMVPRSSVRTCRDAPSHSPRFDIPASVVSLLCHKHCRFRFLLMFLLTESSALRREEQRAERSGIENERRFVCKKTPRPKTRCSTPTVTVANVLRPSRPVPPSRCSHYHQSVFHSPPPLRSRLSGSRNGVILCCSEGRVGAVQTAGTPRCRARERWSEARSVRRSLAASINPHDLKDKRIDLAFAQDRRRKKSPCVLCCLFLFVPLSFLSCVCGPSGGCSADRSVT